MAQFWPKVTEEIKKITTVNNNLNIICFITYYLIILLLLNNDLILFIIGFIDGLKNAIIAISKDKKNYET